jgi:hypothetical protein
MRAGFDPDVQSQFCDGNLITAMRELYEEALVTQLRPVQSSQGRRCG